MRQDMTRTMVYRDVTVVVCAPTRSRVETILGAVEDRLASEPGFDPECVCTFDEGLS